MTSPVTLVRLHPDSRALAQWAVRHRYVGRTGGHDLGYALHAALLHVFGGRAPRPFAYREPDARSGPRLPELLGYCEGDSDTICANAHRVASDDTASVLRPQSLTARTLPASWPADHRLAFELRVRPVVRSAATRPLRPLPRTRRRSLGQRAGSAPRHSRPHQGRRIPRLASQPPRRARLRTPPRTSGPHPPHPRPAPTY